MPKVVWDPDAEEDLRTIAQYIGETRRSPQAARKLVDSVRQKCELHATQPQTGQERPDLEPRLRTFSAGNYVVLYFPMEGGIYVVRVLDARRDYPTLFRS
jgi:plasmid stabilization system protein ParE